MKYNELFEAAKSDKIECSPLNFKLDALSPVISKHTVDVHFNTLTKAYFKKYEATGDSFQKAGAVLHNQFWSILKPYDEKNKPTKTSMNFIEQHHGSWKKFNDSILESASTIHGSGWVMLSPAGKIIMVPNHAIKPNVLLIDLWEHSTVDSDFNKESFIKGFWKIVNWDAVDKNIIANIK